MSAGVKVESKPEVLAAPHELVPIDSVKLHPGNVRQGDVGAISESLRQHGQYRPLVVQRSTGQILAGNHTWKAAKKLGWTEIAVAFVDVDDDQATRILLVDNRTNDLASYDSTGLAEVLTELAATSAGLIGSGFQDEDLEDLIADLTQTDDGDERYTPEWLFEAMGAEFDVDLAAPPGGIPYIPAARYFTKEDDALEQDWTGLFAWCNPPYSIASKFGEKWLSETEEGLWLGPVSHSTEYRVRMFDTARLVWFPREMEFEYRSQLEGIAFPVFLAGFGDRGEAAVKRLAEAEPEAGQVFRRVNG